MNSLGKFVCLALFAFVLGLGFAAVSQATEADDYAIQRQLDAKIQDLNDEMASDSPNRGRIEQLSKEIGELRGKELGRRVDNGQRGFGGPERYFGPRYRNGYGGCDNYYGNGWHHRGAHHGGGRHCW